MIICTRKNSSEIEYWGKQYLENSKFTKTLIYIIYASHKYGDPCTVSAGTSRPSVAYSVQIQLL